MLRAESFAPASFPAVERGARLPAATSGASAGGFTNLFRELRREIEQFIATGSDRSSGMALSAEGAVRRARMLWNEGARNTTGAASPPEAGRVSRTTPEAQRAFVASIAPFAREAAARLGVSPELVIAHAALESGWGAHRPMGFGDRDSFNFFGIKAGSGWRGEVVRAMTTEYEEGLPVRRPQIFRSYPDAMAAFADYARLLGESNRYRELPGVGEDAVAFARALARGGYATDPDYAEKLERLARQVRAIGLPEAGEE